MNTNINERSIVLQTKPYIIGQTMYAARVHFSTTLGTGNIPAREWLTYITSGIMPWKPSPVKLIAKRTHSQATTKHVALGLQFWMWNGLCSHKLIDSRPFFYNIYKHWNLGGGDLAQVHWWAIWWVNYCSRQLPQLFQTTATNHLGRIVTQHSHW